MVPHEPQNRLDPRNLPRGRSRHSEQPFTLYDANPLPKLQKIDPAPRFQDSGLRLAGMKAARWFKKTAKVIGL
jgi:hypothetical protein